MKIYVASSWRNNRQPEVVQQLRDVGHEVYDFKNPEPYTGFAWSEIDPDWKNWTNEQYFQALKHPRAEEGFKSDFDAMNWADICVLVMPCGRSAHTEAGWMQGMNKPTIVLIEQEAEPELMYKIFEKITDKMDEVISHIGYVLKISGKQTFGESKFVYSKLVAGLREKGYQTHVNSTDAKTVSESNCTQCQFPNRYIGLINGITYKAISHCDNCGEESEHKN